MMKIYWKICSSARLSPLDSLPPLDTFGQKQRHMPFIPLEEHLPGITGLLEYRRDTAEPIRNLTQFLMRGPNSLTEAERELIATVVSHRNECKFCSSAHAAVTDVLLGESRT